MSSLDEPGTASSPRGFFNRGFNVKKDVLVILYAALNMAFPASMFPISGV